MKSIVEEVQRRLPRLTMSLVMAIIFWIVSIVVPPTMGNIKFPGLQVEASFLVWITTTVIAGLFLLRALSDVLVLGDILTTIFVKRLGIKQEVSPKRCYRDFIYIIVVILVATALSPILGGIGSFGSTLRNIITYVALGIILVLIYDLGHIAYRIIEEKAQFIAESLIDMSENPEEDK